MEERTATLPGGTAMPLLGFGTWRLKGDDAYRAVLHTLEAGYRHLDTAQLYGNEESVGRALADSGISRQEVFLTTKFAQHHPGKEHATLSRSLERLGVEQVDLWLMHYPLKDPGEHLAVWDAFLDAAEEGMATAVGVSNHSLAQLDTLTEATGQMPQVNQIRFNPALYDPRLVTGHRARNTVLEGHSPLRKPGLDHPVLTEIAETHNATSAQVVIAWHLAYQVAVIPRSAHPERISSNLHAARLHLAPADIARIDALSRQPSGTARTRNRQGA
ncbi:aldo/keto reductase [Streptomyces sp. QH1-20]|uniref:aldo/keto reductase n=1 Tax=Streptomyces sp. QH1-20 TaxID=3240934 RepID=UPI003514ED32